MRVAFTANEGGFEADDYTLIVGVTGGDHGLVLQRDAEEEAEDWGIHLVYNDQANGDYGCVAACRVGPDSLSIDLARQLGGLNGVTGFDVTLRLELEQIAAIQAGLRRVFRGHLEKLAFV